MNAYINQVSKMVGGLRNLNEKKAIERAFGRQLPAYEAKDIVLAMR